MTSKQTNLEIQDLRKEMEDALAEGWANIMENQHDHVRRTRCVNAVEAVVRRFLDARGCRLAPICKYGNL